VKKACAREPRPSGQRRARYCFSIDFCGFSIVFKNIVRIYFCTGTLNTYAPENRRAKTWSFARDSPRKKRRLRAQQNCFCSLLESTGKQRFEAKKLEIAKVVPSQKLWKRPKITGQTHKKARAQTRLDLAVFSFVPKIWIWRVSKRPGLKQPICSAKSA
jgi:hypothetical protein